MTECTSFEIIGEYLPPGIRESFLSLKMSEKSGLTELRINSGRAAALIYPDRVMYLTPWGLTADRRNKSGIIVMPEQISAIVDSLAHYSLHSCSRQLTEGVFVLRHSVRVGLSGSYNSDGILTDITGLNFRISRNIQGCAAELHKLISDEKCGVLICGGVNSGKTTMLRDLCRLCGNMSKVTLVDDRNEIACTNGGIIENDVGTLTNVLTGCSRAKGIISAVRTLSPDYIFCDEIATDDDISAIFGSIGCGVKFCASAHGNSFDDIMNRKNIAALLKQGIFGCVAILKGADFPGIIKEIRRVGHDF